MREGRIEMDREDREGVGDIEKRQRERKRGEEESEREKDKQSERERERKRRDDRENREMQWETIEMIDREKE